MTFLIFKLVNQYFGVNVKNVREVIEYREITKVPLAPKFLEGLLNLRGHAVAVIDLRKKLGFEKYSIISSTCIIILELEINNEMLTIGAIVDEVEDVIELGESQIDSTPSIGLKINQRYIQGIGKLNDKFILLINVEKIFSIEELDEITDIKENL